MIDESHPIDVDLERILPILARQIYTSPFAFLRENVQNAFDAIRVQKYRDSIEGVTREHKIEIALEGNRLSISDTGIGMSQEDLASFYWSIGKSGKHTHEAKAAGVVGTFGIGGMANFGVCSRLEVVTRTHECTRFRCWIRGAQPAIGAGKTVFSTKRDRPSVAPGTTVTGTLMQATTTEQLIAYLTPIVRFLDVACQGRRKTAPQRVVSFCET